MREAILDSPLRGMVTKGLVRQSVKFSSLHITFELFIPLSSIEIRVPGPELGKLLRRQVLDRLLDVFNRCHAANVPSRQPSDKVGAPSTRMIYIHEILHPRCKISWIHRWRSRRSSLRASQSTIFGHQNRAIPSFLARKIDFNVWPSTTYRGATPTAIPVGA